MISYLILLPLLSSSLALVLRDYFRYVALFVSFAVLAFVLSLAQNFHHNPQFHLLEYLNLGGYVVKFGLDGISFIFVLLTALLTLICVISNWKEPASYLGLFLLLEGIVIGFFSSLDLISFYVLFEASLIPMFFIIGVWGSDNRVYAALKFFLYTFTGSIAFLVAIIFLYSHGHSTDIEYLVTNLDLPLLEQKWLWVAFFIAFAVKIPMIPFHTWLPDAHVEAPTGGSVILAGVLIKMGAYGFLRLSLPLFPELSHDYASFMFALSAVAVVYGSLLAFAQTDIKKVIAYSSIAHMGFVTAGIFSFNEQGLSGAIFQMFSHGLIASGLFLSVGVIYNRKHTRKISYYSGLVSVMPLYALSFIIFTLGSIGLPGTSGFIGEFLTIVGVFKEAKISAAFLALGIILGTCYMLWLCQRIIWGEVNKNVLGMKDLTKPEIITLFTLATLIIILGIQPQLILKFTEVPVHNLIHGR